MSATLRFTPLQFKATLPQALLLAAALWLAPAMAASGDAAKKTSAPAAAAAAKSKKPQAAAAKSATQPARAKAAAKGKKKAAAAKSAAGKKARRKAAAPQGPGPLANFGSIAAPPDVVHVANWVSYTRDNKRKAFVLIDKKQARLYVFDPQGKLKRATPILLGKAVGDHSAPGIGTKPMSQIKEHEKTTPAGRFLVSPGRNTSGEDILWIDYDAAVSMHRLRKVSAKEQRAERLGTPEVSDNRISYGCVNVPPSFYNGVLKPAVMRHGAFVYVLPETRAPQQLFGSYAVDAGKGRAVQLAQASTSSQAGAPR